MSGHTAAVDHDVCVGYAECARMAPAAFRLNLANQSEYIAGSDVSDELLVEAAEECPVNAIRVTDAEGSVVFASA
jgi:ferredoxin